MSNDFHHIPVLAEECMSLLGLSHAAGKLFVDGTLGGGGHSELLLAGGARVIGIDRDQDAINAASRRLAAYAPRFTAIKGNHVDIIELLASVGVEKVDGVLLDLGVSSYQLDSPERGFSFHEDAPLDMRMDANAALSAKDVVNSYTEQELTRIISSYGEEKWAVRIAKFIIERRPLETTMDLVAAIDAAIPKAVRREQGHPARRTFQAIRIEVNGELSNLEKSLRNACSVLHPGGRLAVISFHSLEDRIVKQTFQSMMNPCICPPKAPVCVCGKTPLGVVTPRKPILPSENELETNVRARSAKLRGFEKK